MQTDADISVVGAALADRSRGAMLQALLSGETLSAGELARIAGRTPSGASAHLHTLSQAGLVVSANVGRQRHFQLASPEVADALEALQRIAPPLPVRTLRQSETAQALKRARTCYDHLAGELGVAVTDALVDHNFLEHVDDSFHVTTAGTAWFETLGIRTTDLQQSRRSFARACLDWTERRSHLAGALGAALADHFFAQRLLRRLASRRAVALTPTGVRWLERELGLSTVGASSP